MWHMSGFLCTKIKVSLNSLFVKIALVFCRVVNLLPFLLWATPFFETSRKILREAASYQQKLCSQKYVWKVCCSTLKTTLCLISTSSNSIYTLFAAPPPLVEFPFQNLTWLQGWRRLLFGFVAELVHGDEDKMDEKKRSTSHTSIWSVMSVLLILKSSNQLCWTAGLIFIRYTPCFQPHCDVCGSYLV